jgi:hypothetical protein
MKKIFFLILISLKTFGQKKPEDFGYRHMTFGYKKTIVDVLIQSKKGEENIKKPLFFFCQGSMPQPLLKFKNTVSYGTFPFDVSDFLTEFRLTRTYIEVLRCLLFNPNPGLMRALITPDCPPTSATRSRSGSCRRHGLSWLRLLPSGWVSIGLIFAP